jgi:hypothetical protein
MKNRIRKSKARNRVIEKQTTGNTTWRKFADGTQTVEIVGDRHAQLVRAAKMEKTTPEVLVNRLLEEFFFATEDQNIGTVQKHELSLFRPDGLAICYTEVDPDQVRDFLKFAKKGHMTPREGLWEAFQRFIERGKAVAA